MSTKVRKLSYWVLELQDDGGEIHPVDQFRQFTEHLSKWLQTSKSCHKVPSECSEASTCDANILARCPKMVLLDNDKRNSIVTILESISAITKEERNDETGENNKKVAGYNLVFRSCKYNHSPDYMSSIDGSDRLTDKQMHEGEIELTHLCMKMKEKEILCLFEERRSGVSFGNALKYLRVLWELYLKVVNASTQIRIVGSALAAEAFLKELNSMKRITAAELYVEMESLGSECRSLIDWGETIREDVIVTVKAKPKETLDKRVGKAMYDLLFTEGKRVKRVKLRGQDEKLRQVLIDSLGGQRKTEVEVKLCRNGVVDSADMFKKMESILEV